MSALKATSLVGLLAVAAALCQTSLASTGLAQDSGALARVAAEDSGRGVREHRGDGRASRAAHVHEEAVRALHIKEVCHSVCNTRVQQVMSCVMILGRTELHAHLHCTTVDTSSRQPTHLYEALLLVETLLLLWVWVEQIDDALHDNE